MTTNFISTAELQTATPGIDYSRYDDTTLSGVITRATKRAEQYVDYSFPYETKTETTQCFVDPEDDLIIHPFKRPVRTLTAFTIKKANISASLTLTDTNGNNLYDIDDEDRIIIAGSTIGYSTVSVLDYSALKSVKFFAEYTYTCGYYMYDRPADLIDAVILYCRDEIARTYNTSGASRITQGSVSIDYAQRKDGDTDFIRDAKQILDNYKRVSYF